MVTVNFNVKPPADKVLHSGSGEIWQQLKNAPKEQWHSFDLIANKGEEATDFRKRVFSIVNTIRSYSTKGKNKIAIRTDYLTDFSAVKVYVYFKAEK